MVPEDRMHGPGRRLRSALDVTVLVLMAVVAAGLLYRMFVHGPQPPTEGTRTVTTGPAVRPPGPVPSAPLSLEGASRRGAATAPVAIVEYSDFKCPYCGLFARDTLPALEVRYVASGQVQLVFRQFPLRTIHAQAGKAAEAAECAGVQGKFWPMHDWLFANQQPLDEASVLAAAPTLGLDAPVFARCLAGEQAAKVRADEVSGRALAVIGTPTFFLGRLQPDGRVRVVERLSGARSVREFSAAIERLLGNAGGGR